MPDVYDPAEDSQKSYYAAIEAKRLRGDTQPTREINLVVATPFGSRVRLMLTVDGKAEILLLDKNVAVSLIGELAGAIAKTT